MDTDNKFSLRPADAEDDEFLLRLYMANRSSELHAVGWNEEQIQKFCELQYRAQSWQHGATFRNALDSIVEIEGSKIGRLKVLDTDGEVLLVDIALLPQYQNRGIGTSLLEQLKTRAQAAGKPLRLHVLVTSPGIRLYERLGFTQLSNDGSYIEMVRLPDET